MRSVVTFTKNSARQDGGAIRAGPGSVAFFGNSKVTFTRNHAMNGGAIMILMDWWTTDILFTECATVIFNNNSAINQGGALSSVSNGIDINFTDNSTMTFLNNTAEEGGAVHFDHEIVFQGNTNVIFVDNKATHGGLYILLLVSHFQNML